jgi:hypothetical protein
MYDLLLYENQVVFEYDARAGLEFQWEAYIPVYLIWNHFKGHKKFWHLVSTVGFGQNRKEAVSGIIMKFTRLGVNIRLDEQSWRHVLK